MNLEVYGICSFRISRAAPLGVSRPIYTQNNFYLIIYAVLHNAECIKMYEIVAYVSPGPMYIFTVMIFDNKINVLLYISYILWELLTV